MNVDFITKENFEKIKSILDTKGKNAKIDLLKEYRSDESFVEMMKYCYDPYKQFKIKKIGSKHFSMTLETHPDSIKLFLDQMVLKSAANDVDIATAGFILQYLDDVDLALLFKRILNKDFKLGCNVRSLNEAGYNIPKFEVQLAQPQSHLDKFYVENLNGFIVQTKYDGNRAICEIDEKGNPRFISRGGHIINSCDFLLNEIKKLNFPPKTTLDGEILHKSLNLQNLQSIVSKKDSSHNKGHELTYQIFDILEHNSINCKDLDLLARYLLLSQFDIKNQYIIVAPYSHWSMKTGKSAKVYVQEKFQEALDAGHEGLILKAPLATYEGKRSRNWVKIKERDNLDVEVIGIEEGKDHCGDMMGAVICELDGKIFNVGTGWKESERIFYWKNQNELIGKTIEIGYRKLSLDGIPLEASIQRIRTDK